MRRNRDRECAEEYDHLIKILLLGDSAVGKSSLLLRFCENKFESSFVLTIGVDFKKKVVSCGDKKVKLQVWDTAGQERFRTITPAYFRSAMGVVMVYDITNFETFENTRYWMKNLRDYGDPHVQTVLVGNKSDMSAARQIRPQQGQDLANEYSVPFFETSAKYGSSVESTFIALATSILAKRYPQAVIKQHLPIEQPVTLSQGTAKRPAFDNSTDSRVHGLRDGGASCVPPTDDAPNADLVDCPPAGIALHVPPPEELKRSAISVRRCCGGGV